MAETTPETDTEQLPPKAALRSGWTTGACATAGARAAFEGLMTGRFPDPVTIRLPRGQTPSFALVESALEANSATVGIVKDAGDDPDVTHGALIRTTIARGAAGSGITFRAGEGVGTVTLPGLPLPVGEPAINPAPRAMIRANLEEAAASLGLPDPGDLVVTVSIPGGAAIAEKTMNARLGILGGLSILGTTGVVVPYSCAAWIHSIHRGIDVARAAGLAHIAGATGATSETAIKRMYPLTDQALIDMGDFAGGMLKYLRRHKVERVTIAGGFAKLVKLAQGNLDLHSARSSVDLGDLASMAAAVGVDAATTARMVEGPSAAAVLALSGDHRRALGDLVARRARDVSLATLAGGVALDVAVFDRAGGLVGHAE